MDITLKKFSDLAESIANRRDLSDEALKKIWESKPKNPPIQEGQTLVQQSYIRIDDTYGAIDDEDDCLVLSHCATATAANILRLTSSWIILT